MIPPNNIVDACFNSLKICHVDTGTGFVSHEKVIYRHFSAAVSNYKVISGHFSAFPAGHPMHGMRRPGSMPGMFRRQS